MRHHFYTGPSYVEIVHGAVGNYCLIDDRTLVVVLTPRDEAAEELDRAWREFIDVLYATALGRFIIWCVEALAKVLK